MAKRFLIRNRFFPPLRRGEFAILWDLSELTTTDEGIERDLTTPKQVFFSLALMHRIDPS